MLKFRVNEYITLKLEDDKTVIYLKDIKFMKCKRLFINIPKQEMEYYEDFDSIDEIAEGYKKYLIDTQPYNREDLEAHLHYKIKPEEEFWGHCSNLQVWYENNYNTQFLHSNIAFPLLKELMEVGDLLAKKVFKDELVLRLEGNFISTLIFFLNEKYLEYFTEEEFESLIDTLIERNLGKIKEDTLLRIITGKYEIDMPTWNEREVIFSILHPALNLLMCIAKFGQQYRVNYFMDWVYESLTKVNKTYSHLLKRRIKKILRESKPDEKENKVLCYMVTLCIFKLRNFARLEIY